ncbi:ABC transporter substrate-binding protein [Anaerocolumna aminovalerica]|uniref:ABC transporter substrate-binding protein n=1 Tax=Anaerocolumna aminovalerica TaxID=1527 RepID=UPI000BE2EF2C|nr:extracellular solute-binding protein [Anaerocolumna aminovalerica]
MNKKRLLALMMVSTMALSLLTGCGKNAGKTNNADGDPQKQVTDSDNTGSTKEEEIRVATYFAGSDAYAPVWKEVCDEYINKNPHITIVDESQPTSGSNDIFKTKIQADLAASNPADLILYYTGEAYTKTFEATDLFVTFEDIMKADPEWASNFKDSPLQNVQYQGKQYALPFIGYYEGLFYNKALFNQYNLEEPTTWDNILKAADVFTDNGIVTLSTSLGMPYITTENFIMGAAGKENHRNYFDKSWGIALDCIAELYKKGALPKDTFTISEDDVRLLFTEGKAAMMINGSWCAEALQDNPDMRIIAMPQLPGGTGGESCAIAGFSSGWHMTKKASERSGETLKFLKYLTSPEIMAKFIAKGGSPAIKCEAPENSSELLKSAVEMLDKATYQDAALDSQVGHEAYEWLNGGIQYICEDQMTSDKVLEQSKQLNEN